MKDTPLLMMPEMIRAYQSGLKVQTRRIINRLLGFGKITEFQPSTTKGYDWTFRDKRGLWNDISHARLLECCPYGGPGDKLWFRETWAETVNVTGEKDWPRRPCKYTEDCRNEDGSLHERLIYAADGDWEWLDGDGFALGRSCWRPSIHMPRWASRYNPPIISIRVERLQDISEEDAREEGVERRMDGPDQEFSGNGTWHWTAKRAFQDLWESINGPGSWEANPYVWPIEFEKHPAAALPQEVEAYEA